MTDKSINSLFGTLATKKLPASGMLKTTNNSKQENNENNSFHAKLVDSMKSTHSSDGQTTTAIPPELNNITDTDDINHIIKMLSLGLQTNQTTNTDDNQIPLNQEVNQNIPGNEFTNIIFNDSSSGQSSSANLLKNAQKTVGEPGPEQPALSFSGKLETTQDNTKMLEQRILDITNRPVLSEAATESTGNESILQSSKLSGQESQNEHSGSNPIPDADKISNSNTPSPTEESAKDKILEILKGQHQDKTLFANTDKNSQTQQGLAQAHTVNNESPRIFDVSANTTETKAAKLFDNTTLTNDNGANTAEAAMAVNTSSDNSFFNNQGADTPDEFQVNSANVKQSTEPEKNFTNTFSQISNSNKPLGSLGNDVADNIIQNAKLYTQGGKSEIKIQLNPPELGTLKLEFAFENDILETKITVERSSVKDVIEKDIPRLRELISNADIDVGKLDVSLQDKENDRMDFMNKDFHSGSKSKNAHDFSNHENEYYDDNADNAYEETMVNNTESTQINYLI